MIAETLTTGVSEAVQWPGGWGVIVAQSTGPGDTWGGGTLQLEWSADGTNYVAVDAATTLTADGGARFMLPPEVYIRVDTTSNVTSVLVWVRKAGAGIHGA